MPEEAKKMGEDEVITRGKLIPIIVDLKDFIVSTVKGSEKVVRQEISGLRVEVASLRTDMGAVQVAVSQHSKDIKGLRSEMHQMEQRLSDKIDRCAVRLDDHEGRIASLEGVHR